MNEPNILEVMNINKKFKNFSLQDISFSLPAGYIVGYVGQNGAGKTTTINIINHLMYADSGAVKVNGRTYEEDPIAYKAAIGYIGDESYYPGQFNLKDVRSIQKDFYPTFDAEKFDRITEEWELPQKKRICEYSKGMKVKLMFAAALARETSLLILDEATSGLDPVVRNEVLELLQEYIADGQRSVLFSSHILDDLERIADYIFFIDDGRKVLYENKDELIENYCLVKGGNEDLSEELRKDLIGVIQTKVGFEAITKSDLTQFLRNKFLIEKPSIDQIVLHFIREMKSKAAGEKRVMKGVIR